MNRLTFCALDTTLTTAADGLLWRLQWVQGAAKMQKGEGKTNAQGCPEGSMLEGEAFSSGTYELHLDIAEYFNRKGWQLPNPPILSEITLRFHIEDPDAIYNLQIHITPHSYNFAILKDEDIKDEAGGLS